MPGGSNAPAFTAASSLGREGKAGSCQAFELLFVPHYKDVYVFARFMLGNGDGACDTAQGRFEKALRKLGTYRGDAKPRSWLLSICRHHCLDLRRKRPEWPLDALLGKPRDRLRGKLTFDPCQAWDSEIDFWAAMAGLTPEEREAWFLVDVMGHTSKDAAEVVAVPPSTMRVRSRVPAGGSCRRSAHGPRRNSPAESTPTSGVSTTRHRRTPSATPSTSAPGRRSPCGARAAPRGERPVPHSTPGLICSATLALSTVPACTDFSAASSIRSGGPSRQIDERR